MRLLVLTAAAVLVACGGPTEITVENLEGTWQSMSIRYVSTDGADTVDIQATRSASFSLTVTADGTATSVFNDGVGGSSSDGGQLSTDGRSLTLGGDTYSATLEGSTLTLVDGTSEFDFDVNGSDDPATLTIVLRRT